MNRDAFSDDPRPERFVMDTPEPDDNPPCEVCFRDLDQCPGHDDDPEASDIMAAIVHALHALPGLHPVPRSIVLEINRCEDYLRKHHPEILGEHP